MEHSINLAELQQVVGKYADQYQLLAAAGPLTAATLSRLIVGKSKLANGAVKASVAWFAVKELSGPMNHLFVEQFGYLQSIFSAFGGQ